MWSYYRQRPRFALVLVCVPIIAISLFLLHSHRDWARSKYVSSGETPVAEQDSMYEENDEYAYKQDGASSGSNKSPTADGNAVPIKGIEKYMTDFLSDVQSKFNDKEHLDEYGLKVGNYSYERYTRELKEMYHKFFSRAGEKDYPFALDAFERASLRPPRKAYPPAPDQLVTTDKDINNLPEIFGEWKRLMPDTKIVPFNDRALESWVDNWFSGTELLNIWRRLPRIVLKSDLFRYLIMLTEGGVYADSDTGPVIPASEWGRPYDVRTPDVMRQMTDLLGLANSPDADVYNHPAVDDGNEHGPPALVIGIEFDCVMYGWNWRDIGVSRAVQITQWVMAARPGHPILLDVANRVLQRTLDIEKEEEEAKARGEEYHEMWALEWTGPGIWTDCVYRYLLARYGFSPRDLIRVKRPVRIGDILILPSKTTAAARPDENGKPQKDFDAVMHDFKGRWRHDDPGVQEINRINEEKKKAEEEKKKQEEEKKKQEEEEAKRKQEAEEKKQAEEAAQNNDI